MLTTERLIIRPFKNSDFQDLYEYLSLKESYRFERGAPVTLKEAKKICRERVKDDVFWAVTLKDTGKLIGQVSLNRERPDNFRTWNIGYMFNPAFQNKGYATEAARAVIRYAFAELNAHRVVGHCSPDNTASWKVLENCGMKKEGLSRKDFLVRTGENGTPVWLDSFEYAIIEDDLVI
ncbi:MAG: GNAT family N-acetyltransferase [Dehalococcoidales bacterium]|jgi:RimJ/RimL family protein N-acetyltransferase